MPRRPEGSPPVVTKVGLGYRMDIEDIRTAFHFSRVRRRSNEITGYMTVRTKLPVKTIGNDDILLVGALNISGPRVRAEFAKQLTARTPGFDIDWEGLLAHFDQHINAFEVMGEPIKRVGATPVPKTAGTWAIEPFAPRGVAALFYGPGGSGKSRLALACGLSIQLGREILPGCPPAMKGNILYLDWETDGNTVAERIQSICAGIGVEPVDIAYRRCTRPLADDVEELAYFVNANQIVFTIVDSTGMAIGRQSEYTDTNEGVLRLFEGLRVLGTTTMLIDHVSKQEMRMEGKVRGLVPYGSIYKVNLARAAWEVRPIESVDENVHISAFFNTKANDSRLLDPFGIQSSFLPSGAVRFTEFDGPLTTSTTNEWSDSVGLAKNTADQIDNLLTGGGRMLGAEIARALGADGQLVRQTLYRGEKKGKYVKDVNGFWSLAVPSNIVAFTPPGGRQDRPT